MLCRVVVGVIALIIANSLAAIADEPAKKEGASAAKLSQAELIKKLEDTLTGAKLVGSYSVTGREDRSPRPEEYTISSAVKLPEGDLWILKARIKYGDKDATVPIPLEIKWAGDTPVITLTDLTIPGLGTFTSRVVIYEGRYAGTWQHDRVGGHLFGRIEKASPQDK
jgi:hypothetical protein